jgi:uroporphyrin-III C-methyltransferase
MTSADPSLSLRLAGLHLPDFVPGTVWLAGSGPGDPGLLTLQVLHALNKADVIVHDALVSRAVLALAHEGATFVAAGKRGGRPSPRQRDISAKLVELARTGRRVLRLKGGDPFLFGRGGEEALALVAAGIPFRVLPGLTAGMAGLEYAGIPLTHRDTNQMVTFITGQMAGGELPQADWAALAKISPALVIYMGRNHIGEIAKHLIAAGRPSREAVALIANATLSDQQVVETTLGNCAQAAGQFAPHVPLLIVIGEIVKLRTGLDWLGALQGRRLDADPLDVHAAQAV